MTIKDKIKVAKSRPRIKDKLNRQEDEPEKFAIKVKTPRKEHVLSVEDITISEATEKVKKEYPTFTEFEYKTITYKKTGKDGEFIKRIDPPEKIEERWQKKKEHIRELSDNVGRLKNRITRDLKGDDEKLFLTALIIAIILRIGERIGNEESANYVKTSKDDKRKRAFGVSGFKKSHVDIIGNKIHLNYIGKKGVQQEKSFSDEKIAKALKTAIKKSPTSFIFTTSEGQKIGANQVNEFLRDFNITAKGIRGYYCNRGVLDKLKETTPGDSDKKRKKQLNIILKNVASKVGHGPSVLRNQYLMPEVITSWIDKGEVFDIKEAGYVMNKGGKVDSEKENYINQVESLKFKPVSNDRWETIMEEGLDEERGIFEKDQWEQAELILLPEDIKNLKSFNGDTINKFNQFDIRLKEKFKNRITDLIDYDNGKVFLVRPKTIKDKGGNINSLLALNGKPSNLSPEQYELVRSKNFLTWFGNWISDPENASKVVDINGEPLICYHGTEKQFNEFDIEKAGAHTDTGMWGKGFYFTNDLKYAKTYANRNSDGFVIESFLNIRNPLFINSKSDIPKISVPNETIEQLRIADKLYSEKFREYLIDNNYDGVISTLGYVNDKKEYVILHPNQVKLADGTNTTFDSNNTDIRYESGGGIPDRYKEMGFTRVGQKKRSIRPEKKWMVLAKKGDKYRVVHGGQKGMEDFSQHHDKERQKRFWSRMGGFDSEKAKDPFSPLYWHKRFGTWEEGGALPDKGENTEQKEYNNILLYSINERIEFIENVLISNPYYSEKTLDFKSLSERVNEFIELHLEFNKYNPIITRYEDKAYFEPDKRHIDREGYLLAQVEYALHFITGSSEDKKQRFYDQAKYEYIKFIIPTLRNPDERLYQKENDSIIYVKNIIEKQYCCAVLYIELDSDGSLRVVTVLPQQKEKQVQKKKASGRWTDASFISLSTEKSSSDEAVSETNDDIDDSRTQDKDTNNNDTSNKNFEKGGNIGDPIKIFDKDEILQEKDINLPNNDDFTNLEKTHKFIQTKIRNADQTIEGASAIASRTTIQAVAGYHRGSKGTSQVDRNAHFRRQDEKGYEEGGEVNKLIPKKITKDELQSILSGTSKTTDGDTIQAALAYIRTEEGTNPISGRTKSGKKVVDLDGLEFKKMSDNLFVVTSDTQEKLAKLFVRPNSYLDCRQFKGKTFTLKEFSDWYAKEKGAFTYYQDYKGFNIPDSVIDVFLNGDFDPLSEEEKWLMENIKSSAPAKPYYVIGYVHVHGEEETRHHELAHALYYLSPTYKNEADDVIEKFWKEISPKALNNIQAFLTNLQYDRSIWSDEMNAYLVADKDYLIEKNAWSDEFDKYRRTLSKIFEINYLKTFGKEFENGLDQRHEKGGSVPSAAQKQIDEYIKEGVFMTEDDSPVVGLLPISRFNGPKADIFPNQLAVEVGGVKKWTKRIQSGERPYVLIDYSDWAKENRVKDAHHRLKAYEELGFSEIPVIDRNGRILNPERMAAGGMPDADYKKWKRQNVTLRGMKEVGQENSAGAMLGKGLYTAALSNKALSKEYGTVYFAVNAKPKNPKKFNTLNDWEIWFYNNLVYSYSKAKGKDYPDKRDFNANATIEGEMQKLGYDGIEITGRETVNFTPSEDVMYFRTEDQLRDYYDRKVARMEAGGDVSGNKKKAIFYHGVKNKEDAEKILKEGFKLSYIKPLWQNDYAISVVKNPNAVRQFFGRKDVPIIKIEFEGKIVPPSEVGWIMASSAQDYTRQVVEDGIDAVSLEGGFGQSFIYNPKAITKISLLPEGAKKEEGGAIDVYPPLKINILYLHGLDATPESDHVNVLKNENVTIIAPKLNYREKPLFDYLSDLVREYPIHAVIGHSIGGYLAYYLSNRHRIPALMLNPAFGHKELYLQPIPENIQGLHYYFPQIVVIGSEDDKINIENQTEFFKNSEPDIFSEKIGHDIPDDVKIKYFNKLLEKVEEKRKEDLMKKKWILETGGIMHRTVFSKKKEIGGTIDQKQSLAKKKVEELISKLSKEDLKSLKDTFDNVVSEVLVGHEKKLNDLESKKFILQKEIESLYEKEKGMEFGDAKRELTDKRRDINSRVALLDLEIRHQQNIVKAISNGGELVTFTDKKGTEHREIPYFVRIPTDLISFNEDTILTDKVPPYIPSIDEKTFASKGYVFDAIRIAPDQYMLAVNGYKEVRGGEILEYGHRSSIAPYHPSASQQGYVIVSLDQLALINDYYFTKAKAVERKKAEDSNIEQEKHYDKLPEATRAMYVNQRGFYHSLPAAVKKKITQPEFEALSVPEKEKLYKPFGRASVKRLTSKLEDDQMWVSFHEMYERFVNPKALPFKKDKVDKTMMIPLQPGESRMGMIGIFGNREVFDYWYEFRDMMKWKILDIGVQREMDSEVRKIALETSFGESNTNDSLKKEYGILVKRQNGTAILPFEISQIRDAWVKVQKTFGTLSRNAAKDNLKISHTGIRLVFASKAAGVFIPDMKTIAVSNKFGNNQFEQIMAHEVAHWIDYGIGHLKGKRYSCDDFESTSGIIARTFRKNMNQVSSSKYINATKECFARAMEQYFAFENFGEDAMLVQMVNKVEEVRAYHSEKDYVSKEKFNAIVKPLIKKFLSEQESFFKYSVEADEPTTTMSDGGKIRFIPISKLVTTDWKLKEVQKDIEEGRLSYSKDKPAIITYLPHLKKYLIQDGNHRTIERIRDGEKSIPAIINEHQPKMYAFQVDDKQLRSLADYNF